MGTLLIRLFRLGVQSKTKRIQQGLLLGVIFLSSASPKLTYAEGLSLTSDEKAWIEANPKIRVHNETAWPPFNFAVEGKPRGYSIDFMNFIAKRIGLEVEYVTGPTWSKFLEMMKSRDLDVMLNIVKTPDRLKYLLYTPPYGNNPNTILSRADEQYKSLQELFGKTVIVPKGFFYEEILKRDYPDIKVMTAGNLLDCVKAVSFGQADAAFGEFAAFDYLIKEHLMSGLSVSGEVLLGDPEYALLNIATRQDLPLLASILSKAVSSVSASERRIILERWLANGIVKANSSNEENRLSNRDILLWGGVVVSSSTSSP